MTIYYMKPARRGASDATRRRIVGNYLAERARRRFAKSVARERANQAALMSSLGFKSY
jgi:hypothetical protein